MVEENNDLSFLQEMASRLLAGRTPGKFLADDMSKNISRAKEDGQDLTPTALDFAVSAVFYLDAGMFTLTALERSISEMGLTPEETVEFIPTTLLKARRIVEEEQKENEIKVEQERKKFLQNYTEEWGLPRLDTISTYFKSQFLQAELVNPRWQNALDQHVVRRPQIEEMLGKIENPKAKSGILMQELYALTNIHPSEALQIFEAEEKTNSYPYIDSLFQTSIALHKNDTGKDPNFEDIESGAMTVRLWIASNPEHMILARREIAMEKLIFGAKTPGESYSSGKPMIKPFERHEEKSIQSP